LRDISPLKSLVRLEFLRLDGNLVEDITPIMELPKLRVLDVTGNPNAQRARLDELSDRGVIVRDYDR
jgi:Leucine-rich repeat (LRR) protein